MRIFAIGDLHLSLSSDKPMDVFGGHWKDHHSIIESNWRGLVEEDDLVLLPGDLSWAMDLEEAHKDLEWVAGLPGQKLLIKGNHDYWWSSVAKLRRALPADMIPLQHTAFDAGRAVITGTRGWLAPCSAEFREVTDSKVYRRELLRLGMALEAAAAIDEGKPLIVMMHYPPVVGGKPTEFARMLSSAGADVCVYGHLHNEPGAWPEDLDVEYEGVRYMLVSADYLKFTPVEIELQPC